MTLLKNISVEGHMMKVFVISKDSWLIRFCLFLFARSRGKSFISWHEEQCGQKAREKETLVINGEENEER